jgi:hypothetical protein
VIDAATQTLLQGLVQREGRTLLQYLGDSFPWAYSDSPKLDARLTELVTEERRGLGELVRTLARRRFVPPRFITYPASFTGYNNVALGYMLPDLVAAQRRSVAELERDLGGVRDVEVRAAVQHYLDLKRRHLEAVEQLPIPQPEPVNR